jgi:thiol-disulfide isomerase/thioredoxin
MKQRLALAGVLLLAAAGAGTGEIGADGWERLDAPLAEFVVEALSGESLASRDLAGRVVMIDFWATWCAPCLRELPGLAAWHDRLEGQDRIALLSFNVLDETEVLQEFVASHAIRFPVYRADALAETLEVVAFPTKLIVDMRGEPRIVYRRAGYAPAELAEPKLLEVLEGR